MNTARQAPFQLAVTSKDLAVHLKTLVRDLEKETPLAARNGDGLLIMELSSAPEKDFARIEALLKSGAVEEIFLFGENPDPKVLMRAMRLGVKEFFPLPLNVSEVRAALERYLARAHKIPEASKARESRVISLCGSKGGVGTTTVAVNLAVAYAVRPQPLSVALLDMNTLFGEIPLFLEITPKFHWGDITKNIGRLDDTFLMNVLTRHKSGVHVLPSPAYLNGHPAPTPAMMEKLLALMRTLFDVVIIDGGQSLEDAALKGLQLSDEVLLISTLSLPCLGNAGRLVRCFTELGYLKKERIRMVINRAIKKGEISVEDAEAGINRKIFWQIPNDYKASMAAINSGRPLFEAAPNTAVARSIAELAERLAPVEPAPAKKKWSLFRR